METKVIIFDFDGTLCDTRSNIIIAFRATMEHLGLDMRDEETCGATIGLTLRDGFKSMYPDFDDAKLTTVWRPTARYLRSAARSLCPTYSRA